MTDAPAIIPKADNRTAIMEEMEKRKDRLAQLLPSHIKPEVALELVQSALSNTPGLVECTKVSIWNALAKASTLGLQLNGTLQEAWLLPYNGKAKIPVLDEDGKPMMRGNDVCMREVAIKEAHLRIGYKGWLKLARNTGNVLHLSADVVYRAEVEAGIIKISRAPPDVTHTVDLLNDRDALPIADIVGAYFLVVFKDGGKSVTWVPRSKLDAISELSQAGWGNSKKFPTRWQGMARKTAILQAFNRREIPISTEVVTALVHEEKVEEIKEAEFVEVGPKQIEAPVVTDTAEEFRSKPHVPEEDEPPKEPPTELTAEQAAEEDALQRQAETQEQTW